jgi:hypothetical protein
MSRVANGGLFAQESDPTHDDLVIAAHSHAAALVGMLVKPYSVSERVDGGGRYDMHKLCYTETVRLTEIEAEVEKPVYGSREFLMGFADLLIFAGCQTNHVGQTQYTLSKGGWVLSGAKPDETFNMRRVWRGLVEAKSGPFKMGDTMRQMKAYSEPLRADALVVLTHPGNRPGEAPLALLAAQGFKAVEWSGTAFAALNFTPAQADPEYQAPPPLPVEETRQDRPTEVDKGAATSRPFSWHAFMVSAPTMVKALLLTARAEVSDGELHIMFDSRHAFHYRQAEQRLYEIASLAGMPTRLSLVAS